MGNPNVFNIKKTLKLILGDKYNDALNDPKSTLLDIPYEHLVLLIERVSPSEIAALAEDLDDQNTYELMAVAKNYIRQISDRMELFRLDSLNHQAEKYLKTLDIDIEKDNGARDLSDLKRIIRGNLGNYFAPTNNVSRFMTNDIMERYFDYCLDDFKVNRDIEFAELFKKMA